MFYNDDSILDYIFVFVVMQTHVYFFSFFFFERRLQHIEDRAKAEAAGDILERHYFSADETNILLEPLVQTTERYLFVCI